MEKKVFCRKPYGSFLYKWSPETSLTKKTKEKIEVIEYCNAIAFSNGEDWITKYCYRVLYEGGKTKRLAYVTCGYVK